MKKTMYVIIGLLLVSSVFAIEDYMGIQWLLHYTNGTAVSGDKFINISIVDSSGQTVWFENYTKTHTDGRSYAILGQVSPISISLILSARNWSIKIAGETPTSLSPVLKVPYAFVADYSFVGWNDTGSSVILANTTDNVGIGTTTPTTKLDVAGTVNASMVNATVLYQGANQVLDRSGTSSNITIDNNGVISFNLTCSQFTGGAGLCDGTDADTTYACSDWATCSDDSLWDADKLDGQDGSYYLDDTNETPNVASLLTENVTLHSRIDSLNSTKLENGTDANFNVLKANDWTNATITESQISDLTPDNTGGWTNTSTTTSTGLNVNITNGNLTIVNGNIGIGTTPSVKLDVLSDIANGATAIVARINTVNSLTDTGARLLTLKNADAEKFVIFASGGNLLQADTTLGIKYAFGGSGTYYGHISHVASDKWSLSYGTNYVGAGQTNVLTWTGSGNVGIGTTSPTEKLNINGSLRVDNSSGSSVFFVNTTFGNVGIGTTTPTTKLDVAGTVNASMVNATALYQGANQVLDRSGTSSNITISSTGQISVNASFTTPQQVNSTIDIKLLGNVWFFVVNKTVYGTVSGRLNNTQQSNNFDGATLNITEVAVNGLEYYANTSANVTSDVNKICIRYKADGDDYTLYLYKTDGTWVKEMVLTSVDEFKNDCKDILDSTNYLKDNKVGIKITHVGSASTQHKLVLDAMYISSGYTPRVGNEVDPVAIHSDGDTPLTANWNAGAYHIIASYFNGSWNGSSNYYTISQIDTNFTSQKTYIDNQDSAQDECNEITGCVENAVTYNCNTTTCISATFNNSINNTMLSIHPNLDIDSTDDLDISNLDNATIIRTANTTWVQGIKVNNATHADTCSAYTESDPNAVLKDGSVALTANWNAGAYHIIASYFNGSWNGSVNYYTISQADANFTAHESFKHANATHSDTSSIAYDLSCTDCIGGTEIAELSDADVSDTLTCSNMEGTDWGTLTDAKWCVYDQAGTEVDCNVEPVTDTTIGNCSVANSCPSIYYYGGLSAENITSGEIPDARVSDTLTCSDLVAGSEVVADTEVLDDLTITSTKAMSTTGNFTVNNNFNVTASNGNVGMAGNWTMGAHKIWIDDGGNLIIG